MAVVNYSGCSSASKAPRRAERAFQMKVLQELGKLRGLGCCKVPNLLRFHERNYASRPIQMRTNKLGGEPDTNLPAVYALLPFNRYWHSVVQWYPLCFGAEVTSLASDQAGRKRCLYVQSLARTKDRQQPHALPAIRCGCSRSI